MPTLHVRNIPPKLYKKLQARAKAERRTLGAEVTVLLDSALATPEEQRAKAVEALNAITLIASKVNLPPDWPGAAAVIREGRDHQSK